MRRVVLASALLGLAACGEPAISVHLALTETPSKPFTYDCIGAVDVLAMPPDYKYGYDIGALQFGAAPVDLTCIDLDHAPTSAEDLISQLHGRLDLTIPNGGLASMELRARAGHCGDSSWYHEAIMYGGGVYNGGGNFTVSLSHNISCGDTTMYSFRPVNLVTMASSHTCDPVTSGEVDVGDIRPTNFGPATLTEVGAQYAELSPTVTEAKLQTFNQSFSGTCLSMIYSDQASDNVANTCIDTRVTHLCDPNAFDVPVISGAYLDNSQTTLSAIVQGASEAPVLVAVYQDQAGQKLPVQGAVASIPGVASPQTAAALFVYGDLGDPASQSFVPQMTAQATTSSGLFMAYVDGVTEIDVTAPGPNNTQLTGKAFVGPDPFFPTTALIVVK